MSHLDKDSGYDKIAMSGTACLQSTLGSSVTEDLCVLNSQLCLVPKEQPTVHML